MTNPGAPSWPAPSAASPPPPPAAPTPLLSYVPPAPPVLAQRPAYVPPAQLVVAPAPRARSGRGAIIVCCLLVLIGGGVAVWQLRPDPATTLDTPSTLNAASAWEYPVANADFRFTLPSQPKYERVDDEVLSMRVTGQNWSIDGDDEVLSILALDLGQDVDADFARSGIDGMNAGSARRAGGTITSNEDISSDGVVGVRTVITFDGGTFFTTTYARGRWVVSIMAGGPFTEPPLQYTQVVDSFEFISA